MIDQRFFRKTIVWLPAIAWMGLIFYLSSIPHLQTSWGVWDTILRKLAHIGEYAVLCILFIRALEPTWKLSKKHVLRISVILAVLYAISDEYHQSYVAGRCCSVLDVFIDSIGACLGLMVWEMMKKKSLRIHKILVCTACLLCFTGCGEYYHFQISRLYESRGLYAQANHHYQIAIDRYPKRAPEAMFKMGENFRKDNAQDAARKIYFKLIEKYPDSSWAARAGESIMNAPDYFPIQNGNSWIEGDSETGGNNMKLYLTCAQIKEKARIQRKYFAGKTEVANLAGSLYYEKIKFELREYKTLTDTNYAVLIKYPVKVGKTWQTTRDSQQWDFTIADTEANVKVKAGRFIGCLKVAEENRNLRGSIKYNYYAPGVGRVLTTTESPGAEGESRNTELLSYKKK